MKRRLRVLLVSEATRSGAGRSLWLLARGLQRAGCEVAVACSLLRDAHSVRLFERLQREGVRLHRVRMARELHPWRDLRAAWQLWSLMRRGRYDVIHTHAAKGGGLGRLAARMAGAPIIVHTPHAYPWLNETHPAWLRWASLQLERWLARLTDVTVFVSASQAADACGRGVVPRSRSAVIPNAIDVARFANRQPEPGDRRVLLGLSPETWLIGTVGTLEPSKGQADLLRAVSRLRSEGMPVDLLMVGEGSLAADLQRLAQELGCAGHVHWTGHQDDVRPWLAMMDLFVLPSLWEGMPLALLEAMASGVPVIATRVHGAADLIRPYRTGLLVSRRAPEHLALAIRYLLERPAEAAVMASQAQQEVGRNHAIEQQVLTTLRLYRRSRHRQAVLSERRYHRWKRILDLLTTLLLGFVGAPLILLVALVVRSASPGPVIIRQKRLGWRGRPFLMYKFRTMTTRPPLRVTRLGAWLRRSGLDELPQLVNVLKGEMSLVGPRPHLPEVTTTYAAHPVSRRRLTVPVGITGWAQLRGREWNDWDRLQLDAAYLQYRSLRQDLRLLVMTLPTLFGWPARRWSPTRPLPFDKPPATLHPTHAEQNDALTPRHG